MNIYALTIKQFKNLLVNNKYTTYQNQLEDSLIYPFYNRSYYQLTADEKINYITNNIPNCQQYCCYNAGIQYHKTCSLENNTPLDAYKYTQYKTIKYDTFINAKYQSMDKIKVRETIWLNTTKQYLVDKINITGNFTILPNGLSNKLGELSYIPNTPNGLKLNNIPVSYISGCTGGNAILRKRYQQCLKLDFTIDLSTYCKVIDCILNFRKYKHNYFGKLPFELIKYILYLTSLS